MEVLKSMHLFCLTSNLKKYNKVQKCKHQPKNRTQRTKGKALSRPKILYLLCLLVISRQYLVKLSR